MSSRGTRIQESVSSDEFEVRSLYERLLESWNKRSASDMAALFEDDGIIIGFDGSQHSGRLQIESEIGQIFAHHQTPPYVGKIKEVRLLTPEVALLRAIAGMVPPGKSDLDSSLNAIQSLVARKSDSWRIVFYQNTPAQFHGRPELVQQMTKELRQLL